MSEFLKKFQKINLDTPHCCLLLCLTHLKMFLCTKRITQIVVDISDLYHRPYWYKNLHWSFFSLRHFFSNWKQNKYTKEKKCRSGISPIWHFIKRFALFWMNMKEVISAGTKSARKVLLNLTHCLDKHVIWCLRWLSFSLTNYILFSRC